MMIRSLKALVLLALLAAPAAAADLAGAPVADIGWRPVSQTVLAIGLLILLARGTDGEASAEGQRARGRGRASSLSSGSW